MVRLPPSRHTLHCGLRIPDLRTRDDSPLRRSCHHVGPASCRTRRLRAQRIRRCGLNATFRTRLQRCDGDWWPLSLRHSRVAHAAPLGTNTEICDTVRLFACDDCTFVDQIIARRLRSFFQGTWGRQQRQSMQIKWIAPLRLTPATFKKIVVRKWVNWASLISPHAIANSRGLIDPKPPT